MRTIVVLPPGYEHSGRRYPVVFLFHGGLGDADEWLLATDLLEFTERQPEPEQAIVVLPDGGYWPLWVDWADGSHPYEQFFADVLVPYIDATFRTIPGGAHRSVAGFSGGGAGAVSLAARRPDLFGAVASFSGPVDFSHPLTLVAVHLAGVVVPTCEGSPLEVNPFAIVGNPVVDPSASEAADPVLLAPRLYGLDVRLYAGNQIPRDARDIADTAAFLPYALFEDWVHESTDHLHAALTAAGVPHVYDECGCGVHTHRYMQRDLHHWWAPMIARIS